jgi:hypothetical protein
MSGNYVSKLQNSVNEAINNQKLRMKTGPILDGNGDMGFEI